MVSTRHSLPGAALPSSSPLPPPTDRKALLALKKLQVDGTDVLRGGTKEVPSSPVAGQTYSWRGSLYAVTGNEPAEWLTEQPKKSLKKETASPKNKRLEVKEESPRPRKRKRAATNPDDEEEETKVAPTPKKRGRRNTEEVVQEEQPRSRKRQRAPTPDEEETPRRPAKKLRTAIERRDPKPARPVKTARSTKTARSAKKTARVAKPAISSRRPAVRTAPSANARRRNTEAARAARAANRVAASSQPRASRRQRQQHAAPPPSRPQPARAAPVRPARANPARANAEPTLEENRQAAIARGYNMNPIPEHVIANHVGNNLRGNVLALARVNDEMAEALREWRVVKLDWLYAHTPRHEQDTNRHIINLRREIAADRQFPLAAMQAHPTVPDLPDLESLDGDAELSEVADGSVEEEIDAPSAEQIENNEEEEEPASEPRSESSELSPDAQLQAEAEAHAARSQSRSHSQAQAEAQAETQADLHLQPPTPPAPLLPPTAPSPASLSPAAPTTPGDNEPLPTATQQTLPPPTAAPASTHHRPIRRFTSEHHLPDEDHAEYAIHQERLGGESRSARRRRIAREIGVMGRWQVLDDSKAPDANGDAGALPRVVT